MQLTVTPDGNIRCIYGEEIDLHFLGIPSIARASFVEPDQDGRWIVDLSPVGSEKLGPFRFRSDALNAEQQWLAANWA